MKTRLVTKAILYNEKHEVLLLRRSKTDIRRPLEWDLVGGMAEEGESFNEACSREIKEEVGFDVPPEVLHPVKADSEVFHKDEDMNVLWVYFVTQLNGRLSPQLSFEHDDFIWCTIDKAISIYQYERHRELLEYVQKNRLLDL